MGLRGIGRKQTAGTSPHPEPENARLSSTKTENGFAVRTTKRRLSLALARIELTDELTPAVSSSSKDWTVTHVCEIYLADLTNTASPERVTLSKSWLNEFCGYCGC